MYDYSQGQSALQIGEAGRKLAAAHLKQCPVCNSLVSTTSRECFVCRWHGRFIRDEASIADGLGNLLIRCPEFRIQPIGGGDTELRSFGLRMLLRRLRGAGLDIRI